LPAAALSAPHPDSKGDFMATRSKSTFQKRQKEMKRQDKQRMKAERRAQKRLANRAANEPPNENLTAPAESKPQA
jgi:hypothetical protein